MDSTIHKLNFAIATLHIRDPDSQVPGSARRRGSAIRISGSMVHPTTHELRVPMLFAKVLTKPAQDQRRSLDNLSGFCGPRFY